MNTSIPDQERAPRTYAVCVYCKHRRTDRSLFTVDPYFPAAGVNYRCLDLDACGERRRAREVAAAERRQARREAAELEQAEIRATLAALQAESTARLAALQAERQSQREPVAGSEPNPRPAEREGYWWWTSPSGVDHLCPEDMPCVTCGKVHFDGGELASLRRPELLDMRYGPQDHMCRGSWQYTGLNRGGHETYRCDSGRHTAIAAHVAADHVCNPVACGYVAELIPFTDGTPRCATCHRAGHESGTWQGHYYAAPASDSQAPRPVPVHYAHHYTRG